MENLRAGLVTLARCISNRAEHRIVGTFLMESVLKLGSSVIAGTAGRLKVFDAMWGPFSARVDHGKMNA
jgi:hypothetical protein